MGDERESLNMALQIINDEVEVQSNNNNGKRKRYARHTQQQIKLMEEYVSFSLVSSFQLHFN